MFAARCLVLLLLTYYAWGMGHLPAGELDAFGRFVSLAFFPLFLLLYMLPTYEAWKNEHPNLAAIALVNLFLGWTVLGWVVAIVWAFRKPEPVTVSLRSSAKGVGPVPQPVRQTKTCAFCAEEILAAAIKCKHCGSDVRVRKLRAAMPRAYPQQWGR